MKIGHLIEKCQSGSLKVNVEKTKVLVLGDEEGSMCVEGYWSMFQSLRTGFLLDEWSTYAQNATGTTRSLLIARGLHLELAKVLYEGLFVLF